MDTFQLMIFDQTASPQCSLGPWWCWEGDMPQLRSASNQLLNGPNPGSLRIFTVAPGLQLPTRHDLHWNDSLEDERELQLAQANDWLKSGGSLQLFVYNGDSDCIRHLLALPVPKAEPWFPKRTPPG